MNKGSFMYCGNTTFPHAPMVKLPPWYNDLLTEELTVPKPEELEKAQETSLKILSGSNAGQIELLHLKCIVL